MGKKILFVGDSLTLNQYGSFLCMLHAALPTTASINFTKTDTVTTVKFDVSTPILVLNFLLVFMVSNVCGV